jgi:hypothetical protein
VFVAVQVSKPNGGLLNHRLIKAGTGYLPDARLYSILTPYLVRRGDRLMPPYVKAICPNPRCNKKENQIDLAKFRPAPIYETFRGEVSKGEQSHEVTVMCQHCHTPFVVELPPSDQWPKKDVDE